MRAQYAEISLRGAREDNQDRVTAAVSEQAAMLLVLDGMGGHAEGERAAELARRVLVERFWHTPQPLLDPLGFLHVSLGRAHEEVAALGIGRPIEHRPRATCAICIVQEGTAWWAHMGDSRIYLLRDGAVKRRTRDHSHVEVLLQEGLISEAQAQVHPMRNYVECCLGGDPILPEMSMARCQRVQAGDVLLVCSDGFWANLSEEDIVASLFSGAPLRDSLQALADSAVRRGGAGSDNTSAAVLRLID
ncbi:MAG: PP2C family serine/threonine-protein phosphatase [Steroidobacteraceae bacterium]